MRDPEKLTGADWARVAVGIPGLAGIGWCLWRALGDPRWLLVALAVFVLITVALYRITVLAADLPR